MPLTAEQAVERARELAASEGWLWIEPAAARLLADGHWEVQSNRDGLGARVRVLLDARTGQLLEQGYIPR